MDGLMLDTEPLYKAAWQEAASLLGYELDDRSYLNLVGRSTHDSERELLRNFGTSFPVAEFRSRWSALWRLRVAHTGIPPKPGLLEFLSFVEGQRLPIAVATSSDRDYTEFSLRHAGLPSGLTSSSPAIRWPTGSRLQTSIWKPLDVLGWGRLSVRCSKIQMQTSLRRAERECSPS
jgi:hypothetical protein